MITIKDDKEETNVELSLVQNSMFIGLCATNSITKEKVNLLMIKPNGEVLTNQNTKDHNVSPDWLKKAGFRFDTYGHLIIK